LSLSQAVEFQVLHEPGERFARFEGNDISSDGRTSQYGVRAHVGAHVSEKIAGPQEMEKECHFCEFVQADIEITRGARHARLGEHLRPIGEFEHMRCCSQPRANLPRQKASNILNSSPLAQGVIDNPYGCT